MIGLEISFRTPFPCSDIREVNFYGSKKSLEKLISEFLSGANSSSNTPLTSPDFGFGNLDAQKKSSCLDGLSSTQPYLIASLCTLLLQNAPAATCQICNDQEKGIHTITLVWNETCSGAHLDLISYHGQK